MLLSMYVLSAQLPWTALYITHIKYVELIQIYFVLLLIHLPLSLLSQFLHLDLHPQILIILFFIRSLFPLSTLQHPPNSSITHLFPLLSLTLYSLFLLDFNLLIKNLFHIVVNQSRMKLFLVNFIQLLLAFYFVGQIYLGLVVLFCLLFLILYDFLVLVVYLLVLTKFFRLQILLSILIALYLIIYILSISTHLQQFSLISSPFFLHNLFIKFLYHILLHILSLSCSLLLRLVSNVHTIDIVMSFLSYSRVQVIRINFFVDFFH